MFNNEDDTPTLYPVIPLNPRTHPVNDVVGLKDLYLSFDVSNSTINTVKDVIASGEDVSGVVFTRDYYTSSYSNGDLERK